MPDRTRYVVAFYELDRCFGGHEEGGWWYDTGTLIREYKRYDTEEAANKACRRANDLIAVVAKPKHPLSSVLYSGGAYSAEVYRGDPPSVFPAVRPHYE